MKKISQILNYKQKKLIHYSITEVRQIVKKLSNNHICVVTAIFGGSDYIDTIKDNFFDAAVDLFIFTDDPKLFKNLKENKNINIVFIPENLVLDNPRLTAKIFKVFLPKIFCNFFKSGIWIDANVKIKNFNNLLNQIKQKSDNKNIIVGFEHNKSRNIIQEALYILFFRKDNYRNLIKTLFKLLIYSIRRGKIYIFFQPILWGGFIFYRNFDTRLSLLWWSFINYASIRDQLSLPIIYNFASSKKLLLANFDFPPSTVKHKNYIHYSVDSSSIMFEKIQEVLYKIYTKLRKIKLLLLK